MFDPRQLSDAERLNLVSQRVGFALWQLQELEGVVATYLVLSSRATRGMGESAGNALLVAALSKPFGQTIGDLKKAGKLPAPLIDPVDHLLHERNWLVHRSRASSRIAVRRDDHCADLVSRLNAIGDKALALIREFGLLVEAIATSHGVSAAYIDTESSKILKKWHGGEAT